jgi:hypothetical protein
VIRGVFGSDGRPYVVGLLYFPKLRLPPAGHDPVPVAFLLDTGANVTMLFPRDAYRLGFRFNRHFAGRACASVGGVGAPAEVYEEVCHLVLPHEDGTEDGYVGRIKVARPHSYNLRHPSILGRDAFDHYVLFYDRGRQ